MAVNIRCMALAAFIVGIANPAHAVDVNGRLEWEWAYGASQHRQQKNQVQLELEFSQEFSHAYLTAITRLKHDTMNHLLIADRPHGQQNFNELGLANWSQGSPSQSIEFSAKSTISLREFYLDFDYGGAQWRVGKQQQVWGQADGLKVLDQVNPQDFSEFILDEFEDSRIPLWMLAVERAFGDGGALQLLWIPERRYHRLAAAGSDFDLLAVPHQQGVTLRGKKPGRLIKDSDVGLRYSSFVQGWDVSLNYLYHYNDFPSQAVSYDDKGVFIDAQYRRNHLLGASASNAFGDLTLRVELGLNSHQYFKQSRGTGVSNEAPPALARGVGKSAEVSSVIGLDWHGYSDTLLSAQWFQSTLLAHDNKFDRDRTESTLSFLFEQTFANETVTFRTLALHSINEGDGLLRPKLKMNISSNVDLWVAADIFYGDARGLYGQFGQQDRILFGVEFGF